RRGGERGRRPCEGRRRGPREGIPRGGRRARGRGARKLARSGRICFCSIVMIYELLYPLRHSASWLSGLNVLRYVPFRVIAATITAMLICFLLSPWFIRELQKKQIGQVIRDEGMI